MNTYKDQFTEWSPAYPVFFHGAKDIVSERIFKISISGRAGGKSATMETHDITINAINKAMKK